ncbi:conserved hypothetical protein [Sulfurihydrogenibium azorense Az-Fu1]|uniref:Outer membrane lipoprotein carrier protein LolA n=1 Tax=Sulfurihydrogenibium azorense (strain DSM 15241 / OCM 825 / Az-Fu1) TaxID=204536 RepID=C1DXC9_SULAA|nr:hypothetical protein [Sulfurihydrogenibium azorense]ACN98294.1 conserved hypothetical protein [Sulfurihydrogenibium azorense Az-Fu1]
MEIFVPLAIFTLILLSQVNSQEEVYRTEPLYIVNYENNQTDKSDQLKNYTVYKVYVFGLAVGDIYITKKDGKIEAKGQTYKSLRFLYNYDFLYIEEGDYKALYEKEKDKEKIYENQEIYEKKPWLPIITKFFKDNVSPQDILYMKIQINNAPVLISKQENQDQIVYIFEPQKSKTKKILVYMRKNQSVPYKIDIEAKVSISLELVKP